MSIIFDERLRCFHLSNARMSYIIRLAAGKYPLHLYWGSRVRAVSDDLLARLSPYTDETFALHGLPLDRLPQAFICWIHILLPARKVGRILHFIDQ